MVNITNTMSWGLTSANCYMQINYVLPIFKIENYYLKFFKLIGLNEQFDLLSATKEKQWTLSVKFNTITFFQSTS
jgi:hypothetical protein